MRIALIEDRTDRMQRFFTGNISDLHELTLISGVDFQKIDSLFSEGKFESLTDYQCILAHRSAFDRKQIELLTDYCSSISKPLVFFSGGITASVYNDTAFKYLQINSKDFYSNLTLFIEDVRNTGSINLLLLQFGTRWRLTLLLRLRNDINYLKQRHSIRVIWDLKINNQIKQQLITSFKLEWLNKPDFSPVNEDQIEEFYVKLNTLISESI
ncbi:hypothetical protein [Mucilaginibacter rubeus]|uniref:hypothetical protein n=1 Tax=Mucilaginibacter rubeus TaxID=2027860 RepID=UPI00166CB5B4|nr:hypothetical protein [Mucilaginibacter rubeus]GGA95696.1 hypothetical protein GCM10011500_09340 [Mucilaginibacter rubeus]